MRDEVAISNIEDKYSVLYEMKGTVPRVILSRKSLSNKGPILHSYGVSNFLVLICVLMKISTISKLSS